MESLEFGNKVMKLLNQEIINLYSIEEQFILIYAHIQGYMRNIPFENVNCFSKFIL